MSEYKCYKCDTNTHVFFYEQEFYPLSNFSSFTLQWKGHRFDTSEAAYHWEKFDWIVFENGEARLKFPETGDIAEPLQLSDFRFPSRTIASMMREAQQEILKAPSAHEAFYVAQRYKKYVRPDWNDVRVDIMRNILRAKVTQHEYVRRKLKQTGDRQLVEDSWRDTFWGSGEFGDGQNMLGKLWMEVREELNAQG